MLAGLYTAATALDAFQTSLSNSSNNLANVNTTAFKRNVVSFEDLTYTGPTYGQVGHGVNVAAISPRGFKEGAINNTGRELDVAISGNGLIPVQLPNGTIQYTRDGGLQRDAAGHLATSKGYLVQPPITIPTDTTSITIGTDGTVSVITSSAPKISKVLGQIQLAHFVNQEGLLSQAGNLYSETAASGPPTLVIAGTNGTGQLLQRNLEQSNVDVSTELTAIVTAQSGYSTNSRVVKSADQMLSTALAIIQ